MELQLSVISAYFWNGIAKLGASLGTDETQVMNRSVQDKAMWQATFLPAHCLNVDENADTLRQTECSQESSGRYTKDGAISTQCPTTRCGPPCHAQCECLLTDMIEKWYASFRSDER